MTEPQSSISRRDFLRACAVTSAGLATGFHRHLAKAATVCPPPVEKLVAGLEIGCSKVCAAVGGRLPDGTITILGVGQASARGVTRWGIVDFDAATGSVREALADAEARSGVSISSVALAATGKKIALYGFGPAGTGIFGWEEICYADRGDGVLRRTDLAHCREAPDCKVLACDGARIENSIRCVKDLGVNVERIVFAPAASAEAVLSANQKKRGALVIDMGWGTTDFAVYAGGVLTQSDSWAVAGENIANDLALDLRIPLACAERLAIMACSGGLDSSLRAGRTTIDALPEFAGLNRETVNEIVCDRVRGAFGLVKCELVNSGMRLDCLDAGVHLTGGCSMLPGISELAEEIFAIPAARARLKGIAGSEDDLENPRLTCVLGMVKLG